MGKLLENTIRICFIAQLFSLVSTMKAAVNIYFWRLKIIEQCSFIAKNSCILRLVFLIFQKLQKNLNLELYLPSIFQYNFNFYSVTLKRLSLTVNRWNRMLVLTINQEDIQDEFGYYHFNFCPPLVSFLFFQNLIREGTWIETQLSTSLFVLIT